MARSMPSSGHSTAVTHWSGGTAIDAQHLGDVWPLVAGTNTHLDLLARLHSGDPTLGQHASMKEGVARPIGEFNEAKPFFGAEPFDDPADRWT